MRKILLILIWLISFLPVTLSFGQNQSIPSFPGAEGFGKYATGGRGGMVYIVTSLNDSGLGSLRWALEAKGPRIVVFEVSGTIELKSKLNISNGDLTIAGQTAPGDGITLKNYPLRILNTNNVIIRFIRSRLGDLYVDHPTFPTNKEDAFEIVRSSNAIIDHCSFSWGTDEVASIATGLDITIQNSIISEALGNHNPLGSLNYGDRLSYYQNLYVHNLIRNPSISSLTGSGLHDIRNIVVYNYGFRAIDNGPNCKVNVYNSYFKPGPATLAHEEASSISKKFLNPTMLDGNSETYGKFYLEGNFMPTVDLLKDQWLGVRLENGTNQKLYLENCKNKDENGNLVPFEIPIGLYSKNLNAQEAYEEVLANVGASLVRDNVDKRLINELKTGTTTFQGSNSGLLGIIDSQNDVGGWPELKSLTAPKDTDRDGIPDNWEIENGLDPNKADDSLYSLNQDYTNIEVYINSMVSHISEPNSTIKTSGIAVDPEELSLEIGKNYQMKADLSPSNATDKTVFWTISNSQIATVNSSGLVTAVNSGTATITAKTQDGGFTDSSTITVIGSENSMIVKSFTLIDASNNNEILEISDGMKIDSELIQNLNLNMRANTSPTIVGSLFMSITGPITHSTTENVAPYALFGDSNGNYSGRPFSTGDYTLTATPYQEANKGGMEGETISIKFSIIEVEEKTVPDQPVLVTPIDKTLNLSNTIDFQWNIIEDAVTYHIQLSEKSDFTTFFLDQDNLASNQIQISDLKSGIQYYWRVRASNEVGYSNWSTIWSFTTKATIKAPTAPVLLGPENLSSGLTGTISLKWTKPENAEVYRVQIAKDEAFTRKQFDLYNIPTETFDINNLEAGTTFYWRVNASNEGGSSDFSETWKFETLKGPTAPNLVSPADGQPNMDTSVRLEWETVIGADSYRLHVSDTRDFSVRIIDQANISENLFSLQNLEEGKIYYWRVRSSNKAGNSIYSNIWSFTTKISLIAPTTPELVSPIQSATVNATNVAFEWKAVNTAEKYQIQVSKFSNFSQEIVVNNNGVTGNKINIATLEPDQVYFWRVRAINASGSSPYSAVWLVKTEPLPPLASPLLVSPANRIMVDTTSIAFVWEMVPEADNYQLEVSKDSTFQEGLMQYKELSYTNYILDSLESGEKYFWRVQANGKRPSSQSETWSFTIEEDLSVLLARSSPVKIKAYPNPFEDILHLEFSRTIEGEVIISIMDSNGITVFEEAVNDIKESITLEIPTDWPKGVYVIRVQGFGIFESKKIIKN
ncbi:fibronectin type III domain-containing protein [Aquiflexum balticum]|nr:Ig-like domain-containing protein [Aquiflexum balticum]